MSTIFRHSSGGVVLFRHGVPHRYLPHQIPYRAHAEALEKIGCRSLLVTSSVGVLDLHLPLFQPLLVSDLLMPDNRLPDGTACTMFEAPSERQGHLVLEGGLFHSGSSAQIEAWLAETSATSLPRVVFAYVPGPRTKTPAENGYFRALGAAVNSMSLGPEVVLANELGIPTAAVVIGHKYSSAEPTVPKETSPAQLRASLESSRDTLTDLVVWFLRSASDFAPENRIYRFGHPS